MGYEAVGLEFIDSANDPDKMPVSDYKIGSYDVLSAIK